jgi:hypothetical protein
MTKKRWSGLLSISCLLASCLLAALQSAQAQCARPVDPSQPPPPLELSTPGALRFFSGAAGAASRTAREYAFAGTRLGPSTASASSSQETLLRVHAIPVTWGTRLVSEGAGQVAVADLERGKLDGSIIEGSQVVLGGLVRMPGSEHERTAFLVQASPRQDIAALEYLYALVLRADTNGAFSFRAFDPCSESTIGAALSQSDLLHEIARRRNALASRLDVKDQAPKPWTVVSLRRAAPDRPLQFNEVRAVVEDSNGPLAGAPVIFSRAPHSGCNATSDRRGIATCILQDNHGDLDDDKDGEPLVATFSGIFSEDRVVPPMATIIPE